MKNSFVLSIWCGLFFTVISTLIIKYTVQARPDLAAQKILSQADIRINGDRAGDIQIHNPKMFARVFSHGSLGLGESYMDGWWDAQALDEFFYKLFRSNSIAQQPKNMTTIFAYLKSHLMNLQSPLRAFQVGKQHYDLGNDLFGVMLDKNLQYSCAYWNYAFTLDEAQENKLDLICKKLYLKPGMKLLDIGCGWGGLARYAAQHYGVKVVGVTISQEQAHFAQEITKQYPVEIRLQDYRELDETFDRIVSVGMFEHVGYKNYRSFMEIAHKLLKDDGLLLLHTIGGNTSETRGDDWLDKYIFPNGMLPSIAQIGNAMEGLFIMEDWHNFGPDYDKTLMAWWHNFDNNWLQLQNKYDQRFYRMWKYYLLSCAGLFRSRYLQLWQIVMSKGIIGGYTSIR